MGKEEDVENEKKGYESEKVWAARRQFLLAHWDDYPRDQLECYSQLFININMIGCVYNKGIMDKIEEMGRGIMEKAEKLKNERKFVYASRGRAEANEIRKKEEQTREEVRKRAQDDGLSERIRQLRHHMLQAICASPMDLISMCDRVQLRWYIERCKDGNMVLRIRQLIVFKYTFRYIQEPRDEVLRTVTDSFIDCEPSISGDDLLFNEVPPDDAYRSSLQRRMIKSARNLTAGNDGFNSLTTALASIGLKVEQIAQQLQGWSQQMDIRAGEVLVASKVLSKNECVKAKMTAAVDEMCRPVCEAMRRGTLKVVATGDGFGLSFE